MLKPQDTKSCALAKKPAQIRGLKKLEKDIHKEEALQDIDIVMTVEDEASQAGTVTRKPKAEKAKAKIVKKNNTPKKVKLCEVCLQLVVSPVKAGDKYSCEHSA